MKTSGKIISPNSLYLFGIFFVLSFYANEQNLGLSKTLETLRRKSNLEEKILDPNLSFVKRVLCSTVNGEKIKA